jgi:hypothetical protein
MSDERQRTDESELIGIIISQGARAEALPRFAAYIWAAAPSDAVGATSSTRAA